MAAAPTTAPADSEPFVINVILEIEEARIPAFLEAMAIDVAGSRQEEGCLRFDLLRDREQTNKFIFYEAYKDEAALAIGAEIVKQTIATDACDGGVRGATGVCR